MTIEYDVREDLPADTDAFYLEPASEDLISHLIAGRFPHLSQVDAQRIAHFSCGNARIAIALARTVERGQTVCGFQDDELFRRLFVQRNDPSDSLLSSAEVLSLVYSFNGDDTTSAGSELRFLASLAGRDPLELHRHTADLRDRDLVQKRGVWRAVLPHALANRLARRALQRLPRDRVMDGFLEGGSDRLIRSFSRRLSFLHDCEEASLIAEQWLSEGGWLTRRLEDDHNFNDFAIAVLRSLAPLSPDKALSAIARAPRSKPEGTFAFQVTLRNDRYVRLLHSLAYDATRFERSVRLMCRIISDDKSSQPQGSARAVLASLFQLYLSGTHAPPEQRLSLLEEFISSGREEYEELGLSLLGSALEAWSFSSHQDIEFGARRRDYGYQPRNRFDVLLWYKMFISCCVRHATSNSRIANEARTVLARSFRGLWTKAAMYDELEDAGARVHSLAPWVEGWKAVRQTLRFDQERLGSDSLARLERLQDLLAPKTLVERARAYIFADLGDPLSWLEDDDPGDGSRGDQLERHVQQIGTEVARDESVLEILLPEILSTEGPLLAWLGQGLAAGCRSKSALWSRLLEQLELVPEADRNPSALIGFLAAVKPDSDPFWKAALDRLLSHPLLTSTFPRFQVAAGLDDLGIARLKSSARRDSVPVQEFTCLASNSVRIGDDDLVELLRIICFRDGGTRVAVSILGRRLSQRQKSEPTPRHSSGLAEVGRELLLAADYGGDRQHRMLLDHGVSPIAEIALDGEEYHDFTKRVLLNLIKQTDRIFVGDDYAHLLKKIARLQPFAFLEVFVGGDPDADDHPGRTWARLNEFDHERNPLNRVSEESVLAWCSEDPGPRCATLVRTISVFTKNSVTGALELRPLVLRLIGLAPDPMVVVEAVFQAVRPGAWSGSRADAMEERAVALQQIAGDLRTDVSSWVRHACAQVREEISEARRHETSLRADLHGRFE